MRNLYVPLSDAALARLRELAAIEQRNPKAQASILLAEALERALRRAERREAPVAGVRTPR